jgi:hypothetical protein
MKSKNQAKQVAKKKRKSSLSSYRFLIEEIQIEEMIKDPNQVQAINLYKGDLR